MADGAAVDMASAPEVVVSVLGASAGFDGVGAVVVVAGFEATVGGAVGAGVGT